MNNKNLKASELMIGDWVNSYDAQAYKVTSIHINNKGCAVRLEFDEYIVETWADKIEPVPLTEEILKANGFHHLDEADYEYVYSRDDVTFCVCKRDLTCPYIRFGGYFLCNTNYVHELQHALRLCGLNDLADNFKVV